jgi:PhnB protein
MKEVFFMKKPEGYPAVIPYLILNNTAGFLEFTQVLFGAKEHFKLPGDNNKIIHAEIKIDDSIIMFADKNEMFGVQNAALFIYVDNTDETYNKAIEMGAESVRKPEDLDYGRGAGVKDPFGNTWWITQAK